MSKRKKKRKAKVYCKRCGEPFDDRRGTGVCPDCSVTIAVVSMAMAEQAGLKWDPRKQEWVE